MAITIGTQLGSHEITAMLGKGGMSSVRRKFSLRSIIRTSLRSKWRAREYPNHRGPQLDDRPSKVVRDAPWNSIARIIRGAFLERNAGAPIRHRRLYIGNSLELTWPHRHGYIASMKAIAAGKFKNTCLKMLDEVAKTKSSVVITKRGRPIARLVPYVKRGVAKSLAGSILKESGDPFSTGEKWNADLP
jgi:prevent-host-death family protein